MSAKLTKEELMEKIKDIDNDELQKKLSELTEEDLINVVGGTTDLDGKDIGLDIECEECHSHNTFVVSCGNVYVCCRECGWYKVNDWYPC